MRSFFGSILLILVLAALGATIYYHWSTNSHLGIRTPPPTNRKRPAHVINMGKRAAVLQPAAAPAPSVPPAEDEFIPDAVPVPE